MKGKSNGLIHGLEFSKLTPRPPLFGAQRTSTLGQGPVSFNPTDKEKVLLCIPFQRTTGRGESLVKKSNESHFIAQEESNCRLKGPDFKKGVSRTKDSLSKLPTFMQYPLGDRLSISSRTDKWMESLNLAQQPLCTPCSTFQKQRKVQKKQKNSKFEQIGENGDFEVFERQVLKSFR